MGAADSAVGRWVGRPRNWALLMLVLGGVPLASGLLRTPPGPVPLTRVQARFTLADEHAKPFTEANLPGHVWVVAFVDPRCEGCTERVDDAVRTLERRGRNLWPMLGLLTVAMAPAAPTAEAAVVRPWRMLTGPDASALAAALAQGDAKATASLDEGRRLAVFDAHARLRGLYENDAAGLGRLLHDVSLLVNRGD